MELGYQFANSLEMGLAGNLLLPNNDISSQQFYYEYSTDYLFEPSLPNTTQTIASVNVASHFESAVSGHCQIDVYPPLYTSNYQQNSIESVPLESSVFLSPQTSAPSSAAQSPQAESKNDVFDLSLDDIFDVDDILNNNEQLITDELLDVLNDVGCSDFLNQLDNNVEQPFDNETCFTSDSSASSTPKRKYSTDSSDCYSVDSFETCSTNSKKSKKARRSKPNRQERVARKKDQNKKAASRYRNKKKNEMQSCEQTVEELESQRNGLSEQVKKLQTEFNVILPLAKAAFTFEDRKSVV